MSGDDALDADGAFVCRAARPWRVDLRPRYPRATHPDATISGNEFACPHCGFAVTLPPPTVLTTRYRLDPVPLVFPRQHVPPQW